MKEWSVYRHTSPSGKVYIGITSNSLQRRWGCNGSGYRNCKLFLRAILKYGWDNIKHEVLFTGLSEERAKNLEIALIRHYKNLKISYNLTDGGDGTLGVVVSEETRAKQRAAKLGKPLSEEHLKQLRAFHQKQKGIPRNDETKRKLHEANKGKKPSAKTMEALKEYNRTHPLTKERIQEMYEARIKVGFESQIAVLNRNRNQIGIKHRKPIVQLTLGGQYVTTYDGGKFASISTGIDPSMITACCKGRQFRAGGYLWMYEVDYKKYLSNATLPSVLDNMVKKANTPSGSYERTAEWRSKKSESLKGIDKRNDETKRRMTERAIEAMSIPVLQLTSEGEFVAIYKNSREAESVTDYKNSYICKACKNSTLAYGYIWRHISKEEYEEYKTRMAA